MWGEAEAVAVGGVRLHLALITSFQLVHLLRWANSWVHLAFRLSCRCCKFQADSNLLDLHHRFALLLPLLVVGVGVGVVDVAVPVPRALKFVLDRPLSSPRIFES